MSKKTKIIISITGIFLVLIAIFSLTYAYYTVKVNGATLTKAVDITAITNSLTFGGTSNISISSSLSPNNDSTILNINFTVKNTGSSQIDYLVLLDNVKVTNNYGNVVDLVNVHDFRYTLTCSTSSGTACYGFTNEVFPVKGGILAGNKISSGATQTYNLTVKYIVTPFDQSGDNYKYYSGRINISSVYGNPYSDSKDSLAYHIINNATLNKSGTTLNAIGSTRPAEAVSTSSERELIPTNDDYGRSYYFRGSPTDNFVTFAGKCWRIVRIEGDGSVKLILYNKNSTCSSGLSENFYIPTTTGGTTYTTNFGYSTVTKNNSSTFYKADYLSGTSSPRLYTANQNFESSIGSANLTKLKSDSWCYDDSAYSSSSNGYFGTGTYMLSEAQKESYYLAGTQMYFGNYLRFYSSSPRIPTLYCLVTNITPEYVGVINADEVLYAGGVRGSTNTNYYLRSASYGYWVLTPSSFNGSTQYVYLIDTNGILTTTTPNSSYYIRPVVTLKSGTLVRSGGLGTLAKPYIVL